MEERLPLSTLLGMKHVLELKTDMQDLQKFNTSTRVTADEIYSKVIFREQSLENVTVQHSN